MATRPARFPRASISLVVMLASLGYLVIVGLAAGRVDDAIAIFGGTTLRLGDMALALAPLLALAALAGAVVDARRGRPAGIVRAMMRHWRQDGLRLAVAMPLSCLLILAGYSVAKQTMVSHGRFFADPTLALLDRHLLGADAWQWTHAILPSAQATLVMDRLYALWMIPLIASALCGWLAPREHALRYFISFILIWVLQGTVLATLLSSAGPCFYEAIHGSDRFAPLIARLAAQDAALQAAGHAPLAAPAIQALLLHNWQSSTMMTAGGISAMPSLHNAFALLFALASRPLSRVAGWVMAGFALAILFGSVHLGYHYLLDGLVAWAITALIWWGVGRALAALPPQAAPWRSDKSL